MGLDLFIKSLTIYIITKVSELTICLCNPSKEAQFLSLTLLNVPPAGMTCLALSILILFFKKTNTNFSNLFEFNLFYLYLLYNQQNKKGL